MGPRRRISDVQAVAEVPSFESVAERHLDDVHAYLVYLTRDRAVAEDLTAETFEKACGSGAASTPAAGARAPGSASSRARPRSTTSGPRTGAGGASTPSPGASRTTWRTASSAGSRPQLERALAALSAGEREVIALRVLLDLDSETAARVLGISPTTCTTRLSRALKKLEERMSADVAA